MVFIREDIPSRKLDMFNFSIGIEGLFIEINLRKSKWLLLATYKPPSLSKHDFFNHVGKALDFYGAKYENFIVMGDLNPTYLGGGQNDPQRNKCLRNSENRKKKLKKLQ